MNAILFPCINIHVFCLKYTDITLDKLRMCGNASELEKINKKYKFILKTCKFTKKNVILFFISILKKN